MEVEINGPGGYDSSCQAFDGQAGGGSSKSAVNARFLELLRETPGLGSIKH